MIQRAEVQNAASARTSYAAISRRAHAQTHRKAGRQRGKRGKQRVPAEQARSRSRWADLHVGNEVGGECVGGIRRVSVRTAQRLASVQSTASGQQLLGRERPVGAAAGAHAPTASRHGGVRALHGPPRRMPPRKRDGRAS